MGLFAGTKWDVPAHCDRCNELESACVCPAAQPPVKPPSQQTVRVRVEKRKAGRFVTLITGLELPAQARTELLTQLKNHCGAGGTQEDETLVIQGDQLARAAAQLEKLGYRVKK